MINFALALLSTVTIIQAPPASGQLRISNPQVIMDTTGSSGGNRLENRIGKKGMEQFVKTGGYIENISSNLEARLSTNLLELESEGKTVAENVRIHMTSEENNDYVMVFPSKLQKDVLYKYSQKLSESGTSAELVITVPGSVRVNNGFLGTILVIVGAY